MRPLLCLSLLAACAHPSRRPISLGGRQDTLSVTYMAGGVATPDWRNALERPYGRLIVGDTAMAMESDKGTLLFLLPLRAVTQATTNVEQRSDGILGARRDELLLIHTTAPDVLTFRVRRAYTAQAAAVKITSRLHR